MGIKLFSEELIFQASQKAGGDDFGRMTFKQGLDVLINSLNHDIDLSEGTAGYFQNQILQILINRIEVAEFLKEHPKILDEKIKSPVFIVGIPRSGTTILQTLMSLDPSARFLRNFETTGSICPPPELIPESVDPRIEICHQGMESFFQMAPDLRGINGINFMAQGTAECQNLMAHEFVHMGWSSGSSLFTHGNWVSDCDMEPAYQWHKRLLQLFQYKLPNDYWVLKAPIHLFGLDLLMKIYPDAKIVFTHREPIAAIASGISMVYHWTRFTTGQANAEAICEWYSNLWAKGLKRALLVKDNLKKDQCFDVFHSDMAKGPVAVIEKICSHFNIRFSKGAKKRMQTWLRDHPRSKFGRHHCTPEMFKLKPDRIREQFGFYMDRFGF